MAPLALHPGNAAAVLAAAAQPRECPISAADLQVGSNLDIMLAARASSTRDLVIVIAGPTTGSIAVKMGKLASAMVANMLLNLELVGIRNTLVLTTNLRISRAEAQTIPDASDDNTCLQLLWPRGICCAFSGIGMNLVTSPNAPGRAWTLHERHPYMLFLQRWWLAAQATARGYNVLSLDTDMHIASNPLGLVRSPSYAKFQLVFQLDSGWPVESDVEGERSTDAIGQYEALVPCKARGAPALSKSREAPRRVSRGHAALLACGCGVFRMPMLNTGFVWVRGGLRSPQWRVFNLSVDRILSRLNGPTESNSKGEVRSHMVWAQAVVNEVVNELARRPQNWPGSECHMRDVGCALNPNSRHDQRELKRLWWLSRRNSSIWVASRPLARMGRGSDNSSNMERVSHRGHALTPSVGSGRIAWSTGAQAALIDATSQKDARLDNVSLRSAYEVWPSVAMGSDEWPELRDGARSMGTTRNPVGCRARHSLYEENLIGWTELHGFGAQGDALLGVLPREAVGRMCGARLRLNTTLLTFAQPAPCTELGAHVLGQEVLHMQFTNTHTRKAILQAMGWWYVQDTNGSNDAPASASRISCEALASSGSPTPGNVLANVVVISSSSMASSLICTVPETNGPSVEAIGPSPVRLGHVCPCCWRTEELRRGLEKAQVAPSLLNTLAKASKWAKCRIW